MLKGWEFTARGNISGCVFGKAGFEDGQLIETSKVMHMDEGGLWCATENGRCYRLGPPKAEWCSSKASEAPTLSQHPILEHWGWQDGMVHGLVFGKKGFPDGEWICTSEIPENNRFHTHVVTKNGSVYRLGKQNPDAEYTSQDKTQGEALHEAHEEDEEEAPEEHEQEGRATEAQLVSEAPKVEALASFKETETGSEVVYLDAPAPTLPAAQPCHRGWQSCKPAPTFDENVSPARQNTAAIDVLDAPMRQFRLL